MDKKQLVIGLGQIGTAIKDILGCDGLDPEKSIYPEKSVTHKYDVIHICFPYFPGFIQEVQTYAADFEASLIVIHSTVPIGTTKSIGDNAVYSPVRGIHPNLKEGIETFTKFFAGDRSKEALDLFFTKIRHCTYSISENATESLEAAKLWDTTQYGLNIILQKEIHSFCEERKLDFGLIYTTFNESYNMGYEILGHPEFKKYILKPSDGPIGGHCILPNCDILPHWICELIRLKNKEYMDIASLGE